MRQMIVLFKENP